MGVTLESNAELLFNADSLTWLTKNDLVLSIYFISASVVAVKHYGKFVWNSTRLSHFLCQGSITTDLQSLTMLWQTTNAEGTTLFQATLFHFHCLHSQNILFRSSFILSFKLHLPFPPQLAKACFSPSQPSLFLCCLSTLFLKPKQDFSTFHWQLNSRAVLFSVFQLFQIFFET